MMMRCFLVRTMRTVFIILAALRASFGSTTAPLDEILIINFFRQVCTFVPEEMPTHIPPTMGRNAAAHLYGWALLGEDEFITRTLDLVKIAHTSIRTRYPRAARLLEIAIQDLLEKEPKELTEEEILVKLTRQYYHALTELHEVKAILSDESNKS